MYSSFSSSSTIEMRVNQSLAWRDWPTAPHFRGWLFKACSSIVKPFRTVVKRGFIFDRYTQTNLTLFWKVGTYKVLLKNIYYHNQPIIFQFSINFARTMAYLSIILNNAKVCLNDLPMYIFLYITATNLEVRHWMAKNVIL